MAGAVLIGVVAMIHGVLFWTDFRGYARVLTRGIRWADRGRRWRYSLSDGGYRRRTEPRWRMEATPGLRRVGGIWAFVVGAVVLVMGLIRP